ncbi:MAG: tetratricopeptide repeat protein [Parahaliea sp.]
MNQRSFSADQQMAQARALASKGQVEDAKRIYHRILAQQPGNKKARKALNALQARAGDSLTREDFERVTQLMGKGRLEAARAEAGKLVRSHSGQPALHNLLGAVLTRMERPEEAVEAFRQALALAPQFPDALNNLGAAYNQLERFQEAADCYRALLQVSPRDADIWFNLGNSLRGLKQFRDSASCYRNALQLRPLSADTYLNLGNSYVDLGDADNAIASYESALGLRDDLHNARRSLARVFWSRGQMNLAGGCYQRLLRDLPEDVEALRGLGNVQRSTGRLSAAAESYSRVLAINPNDDGTRHQLNALQHRRSERAPADYVRGVFDSYAVGFEQHLTEVLGYTAPAALRKLCDTLDMGPARGGRGLDLGCGTGLAGAAFRDMTSSLIGVDLSSMMLREAEKKGVYDELIEGDIFRVLAERDFQAQLILCCDTLVYLGSLPPVFHAMAGVAAPGARFLFTTEHQEQGDFDLRTSARYAHSRDYVERCAHEAGLTLQHFELGQLRQENKIWLAGGLYCLAKPG